MTFIDIDKAIRYFKSMYNYFNKYHPNKNDNIYGKILMELKYTKKKKSSKDKIFTITTTSKKHSTTNQINTIFIMDYSRQKLKINLNNYMTDAGTLQFYKSKILPILEISSYFNIDFTKKIPFEYFGSDDIPKMSGYSFTSYYKSLLNYFGVNANDITTKEVSDGKYEMKINNQIIDVKAWNKIEDVLDNIDNILNMTKNKESVDEIKMN